MIRPGDSRLAFPPRVTRRVWPRVRHGGARRLTARRRRSSRPALPPLACRHAWPAPWAWNPDWWAGYPELQFYPPGFAYAGALLQRASVNALSVSAAYQALVWIAYLAPGLTAFLALARLLRSGWLALPGAFVALTLSAGTTSGVEGGVHIGMIGRASCRERV